MKKTAISLFLSLILGDESFMMVAGLAAILVLTAIGVMMIVRVSIVQGSYQMLLEEQEYTRENKANNKHSGYISAAYWCLVAAAYLAWSFIGNAWKDSWIIWPVAGVAFGAVMAIRGAMKR